MFARVVNRCTCQGLSGEHGVDFGAIFAGAVATTAIPLAVLLFFQRYFTQSLSASGVKG